MRGEDGEYDDVRGRDKDQVLQLQNNMLRNQEDHLDEILGVTKAIKYEGQEFDTEVGKQNRMMKNLKDDFEKTEMKMIKLDNRRKNFIAASSPCYLTVAIIVEILLLILLVLVL